ncbi:TspO/MBR family protein [Seonamhaeicola marinus]|uniref:Tryptophan-rich sensory protein n=1 Tax=Seonamhaeicola marinus TaxID=1912246 RepID=A0A5D0I6D2_9FLAO|nr:TspO/MBR family protein [Seonamhaeicola marinus]TYA78400.1 tryptophan-rich sensory protein [Seonamhaeicola marinus]
MKLAKYTVVFLIINFGALAIGTWLMADGPQKPWYLNLNKAPWTPPGWVFGAAWSTIMLCFSIYMAYLYQLLPTPRILGLFGVQFVLNVGWNYVFFNQHLIGVGLVVITGLTSIIAFFLNDYRKQMGYKTLLILPYLIWLCIASSLNMYILIHN